VSETSPSSVKDSSPAQVLPARHSSHTSSVKQQTATSPVQTTARSSVDSKQGDVLQILFSTCIVTVIMPLPMVVHHMWVLGPNTPYTRNIADFGTI